MSGASARFVNDSTGNPVRTYRLEPLRRNLALLVAGVLVVTGFVVSAIAVWLLGGPGFGPIEAAFVALPLLLLGGMAAAIAWATTNIRLELDASSIQLHVPGATFQADWKQVESLGRAFWGPLSGESLILASPARVARAWWFALIEDPAWRNAIPLEAFALPVRGSRLEGQLREALPRLFEPVASERPEDG